MKSLSNTIFAFLVTAMVGLALPVVFAQAGDTQNAQVDTSSAGLVARVAPGEFLPISVKLSNFGGSDRVDVLIKYSILNDAEVEIYSASETVAVETTASLIKTMQIPFEAVTGVYTAKTSIVYQGQLVPATTQFPFTVEHKILGVFQEDFFLYGGIAIFISIFMILFGRILIKRHYVTRFAPFDYSGISRDKRIFYELISDTVMGMRHQVGESALDIAKQIDGLVIDEKTGRVLKLTKKPSKIIADLVSGYEKILGRKVSLFRSS